jgi:hypothetical protein
MTIIYSCYLIAIRFSRTSSVMQPKTVTSPWKCRVQNENQLLKIFSRKDLQLV